MRIDKFQLVYPHFLKFNIFYVTINQSVIMESADVFTQNER